VAVRRLGVRDGDSVRRLRLRALRDAPDAFGSTYEREVAFSWEVWEARLVSNTNAHFVFETAQQGPVGLVSVVRDDTDQEVAYLVGMWVDARVRGMGAADALVTEAIGWAEGQPVSILRLHVTEGNVPAERLYLRHGFVKTGDSIDRERDGAVEFEMERSVRAS
jgi:ribosomal protein S18 acetylase RimI-like enzyme